MIPFLDLHAEIRALVPELERGFRRVMKQGRFILSEEVDAFEKEFADYLGARHGIGVANGTDAISIALRATGLPEGAAVLLPANTAVPTAAAVVMAGGRPLLLDVEPDRLTLCPDRLGDFLEGRCRRRNGALVDRVTGCRIHAVLPVHLYGRPARMPEIMALARDFGLAVVEDAAHAHGADIGGRRVGTFGHAAAFSFYPTKNLGALGDAGILVTSSRRIAARARELRQYGAIRPFQRLRESGVNSRLDELQAAFLRSKLRHLEDWNALRRDLSSLYLSELRGTAVEPPEEPSGSVHHLFVIRHPHRDRIARALQGQGISTLVHYPVPLHRLKPYSDPRFRAGSLTVSERACREVLSLPLNPFLRREAVLKVAKAVRGCLR